MQTESDSTSVAKRAEWDLEKISRKTDTWLAIFQGMLEEPYHAFLEPPSDPVSNSTVTNSSNYSTPVTGYYRG
jgi:hypothetical protein